MGAAASNCTCTCNGGGSWPSPSEEVMIGTNESQSTSGGATLIQKLPGSSQPTQVSGLVPVKPLMSGGGSGEITNGLSVETGSVTSLLYIERNTNVGINHSASSTADGMSSRSEMSSKTRTKTISMLQTTGLGIVAVPAQKLDKTKMVDFVDRLRAAGIDISKWGYGGSKSVEHLFWETYEQRGCLITGAKLELKRVTRLVKIRLVAEIFGVEHCLFSRMQFMHDGQTVERKQVPLRKLVWNNFASDKDDPQTLAEEECLLTESWRGACRKTLEERLGLPLTWQNQHLIEDGEAYRYTVEDNVKSDGYPGLNTMYCIHEVTFRVKDSEVPGVQVIGLPQGQEFATAEGDFNFNNQQLDNGLPIGTQLNIWTWSRVIAAAPPVKKQSTIAPAPVISKKSSEIGLIRRVPLPITSAQLLASIQSNLNKASSDKPPNATLWVCLEKLKTDWSTARRIASRITDSRYGLHQFNNDLAAFPELNLYLLDEKPVAAASRQTTGAGMSSGRTIGDEFQRTIGAFFAIYWLMRLEVDGKDGFSNGVDDEWRPITNLESDDVTVTQADKREKFKSQAEWGFFRKLLFDAGLLEEKKSTGMFKTTTKVQVNETRLVSLLALTAMHDIMKMSMILPEVQKEHAPYHGYAAGDTIGDHDHALSYVMEHFPNLLPSFRDLDASERRSVQFTQCNLCFNHGWFVQAEAPPGAIFTKFREALIRDHKSQIGSRDVALYFVHWLTDLAGAEPTPLSGCEKFVTKFPLPVLNSFLRSFEFVGRIATETETEVVEEYLQMRWKEFTPSLGPSPRGPSAIAKLRLICMAQMNALPVLHGFEDLLDEDRDMLCTEMALTGCVGQQFSAHLIPKEVSQRMEGPAFLVYYGPAFLQNLGNDYAVRRLSVLAEIYRCAREMWPASVAKVASNVTIRIDVIKQLSVADMQDTIAKGDLWMLVKHNETEAFVERSTKRKLNKMIAGNAVFQVIDLSTALSYGV